MTDISGATVDLPSVEAAAAMGTDTSVDTEPVAAEAVVESGFEQEPAELEAPPELYTVSTVGGEEQVTLEDLRNGYLRQADYTQKTQDLATQRRELAQAQALAEALDRDPSRTLQLLQEAYGVPGQQGQQGQEATPYEDLDPIEQRMVRLEQQVTVAQQAEVNRQIDQEVAQLKATYGDGVDVESVAAHAVRLRVPLDVAYRDMNFQQAQESARIVESKRAAQVVQGAATTQRGAVSTKPKAYGSIREAALAAIKQHGVT